MRSWITVPYPCPDGFPVINYTQRIAPVARSFRDLYPGMDTSGVSLTSVKGAPRPLAPNDIAAILVTHDEMKLIGALLTHYRVLGITRFLAVDDRSSDGTFALLEGQADVDLYVSNVRYGAAGRGRMWRQMLARRYGSGRWYVTVDSDEFLIYPGFPQRGLSDLIAQLERGGIRHMAAPMLDMYPPGRVTAATYDGTGPMPWEVASLFDASGYTLRGDERSWKIGGGVRQRRFGTAAELIKYPLVRWGPLTNINKSTHFPSPYWRNFSPPGGVLLHFKFFSDYRPRFQRIVDRGQHFDRSVLYRQIIHQVSDADALVLEHAVSAEFVGAEDLVARGFMSPLHKLMAG
jgi:hypothetical protein